MRDFNRRTGVNDKQQTGRPGKSTTDKITMCVAQMPASSSTNAENDIIRQLDISLESVHSRVYKQLYYDKVRARWVP
jgi:hypothetical protein